MKFRHSHHKIIQSILRIAVRILSVSFEMARIRVEEEDTVKRATWLSTLTHPAVLFAAFLRFLLFFFGFYEILGSRKEIVTPTTDFKRGANNLFDNTQSCGRIILSAKTSSIALFWGRISSG